MPTALFLFFLIFRNSNT